MCDTCHTHNISFALSSKQEREESFGHNKKRLKRRTKWSFFSEKMEGKRGFYGRYGPRLFFFVIKVEKYNEMGPLKLRTNKCTRFRRVQERSGLLIKKKGKRECEWDVVALAHMHVCPFPLYFPMMTMMCPLAFAQIQLSASSDQPHLSYAYVMGGLSTNYLHFHHPW